MNQVQTFGFGLVDLRVIERDGQPWFVANDVLYALGLPLNSHGKSIHSLAPDQRSLYQIQKGVRSQNVISESGLYKLVMRSDKPEARAFQDWVTRVVLPAIRKDGAYVMGGGESSDRRTVRRRAGNAGHVDYVPEGRTPGPGT